MSLDSSNNSKEKTFSKSLKIEEENNLCKDGFCKLPNQSKDMNESNININLFDPI